MQPNIASNILLQPSIMSVVSGYAKKILYTSNKVAAYGIGHMPGPLMMGESQAPHYFATMGGLILFCDVHRVHVKKDKR